MFNLNILLHNMNIQSVQLLWHEHTYTRLRPWHLSYAIESLKPHIIRFPNKVGHFVYWDSVLVHPSVAFAK